MVLFGLLWAAGVPGRVFAGCSAWPRSRWPCWRSSRSATGSPGSPASSTRSADPPATRLPAAQGLFAIAYGGWFGVGLGRGPAQVGLAAQRPHRLHLRHHRRGARAGRLPGRAAALRRAGLRRAADRPPGADPFRRLAAAGVTAWIVGQALINIGGVVGLLPITGLPLPLISAGGTSLVVTMLALGMLALVRPARAGRGAAGRTAAGRRASCWACRCRGCRGIGRGGGSPPGDRRPEPGERRRRGRLAVRRPPTSPRTGGPADDRRVVLAGGGTAGHIEPLLASRRRPAAGRPRTSAITCLGTAAGLETELVPARGYDLGLIPAVPLPRGQPRTCCRCPAGCRCGRRAAGEVLDEVRRRRGGRVRRVRGGARLPGRLAPRRSRSWCTR